MSSNNLKPLIKGNQEFQLRLHFETRDKESSEIKRTYLLPKYFVKHVQGVNGEFLLYNTNHKLIIYNLTKDSLKPASTLNCSGGNITMFSVNPFTLPGNHFQLLITFDLGDIVLFDYAASKQYRFNKDKYVS